MDVIQDSFCDKHNLEEASSLARMIQVLNPKLLNKKGKEEFYAFRAVYKDIYISMLSEFLRDFLGAEDLNSDCTPESIRKMADDESKQLGFNQMFRSFIIKSHDDYGLCSKEPDIAKGLPLFYPHHNYVRIKEPTKEKKVTEEKESTEETLGGNKEKPAKTKVKEDSKNAYSKALLSMLGSFFLLMDAAKQGNGLLTFIVQKKLHKPIQQSGHKNYAVSLLSFKHNVLSHPNAQFAHQFMWNTSAGRKGKGTKFPRDQKVEHLNRFLKDSFRSLGPNLNSITAGRVNNCSDFGLQLEDKVVNFFELTRSGKSHTLKDHTSQVNKISTILKKESIVSFVPGRKFKGPTLKPNFFNNFDEVKFRTWHLNKDKELHRSSKRYRL